MVQAERKHGSWDPPPSLRGTSRSAGHRQQAWCWAEEVWIPRPRAGHLASWDSASMVLYCIS